MYYTIISTSGWQCDSWRIEKTLQNKAEADAYAKDIRQRRRPDHERYNVKVMAHHKNIRRLLIGLDTVRFSDGMQAHYD